MSDDPIEPQNFRSGVTVIDIGDIRVARGMTRRPASSCRHPKMIYDPRERRIWCPDCEKDVDPFDAFCRVVEHFDAANLQLTKRKERIDAAEQHHLVSLAAKEIDKAWRHRSMVPACPCCGEGLLPEDFKRGVNLINREWATIRRQKRTERRS